MGSGLHAVPVHEVPLQPRVRKTFSGVATKIGLKSLQPIQEFECRSDNIL